MRQSAARPMHPVRPGLLSSTLMLGALACGAPCIQAEDHPPAPVPAANPPAAPPQPLPLPLRPTDQGMQRRPHQTVEVIPVENAEALAAKLHELVENGLFITAVTSITANGKPAVVVVGMPQPMPPQRQALGAPPRPAGGPGPVPAGQFPPPQDAPPPPPAGAPPPPKP